MLRQKKHFLIFALVLITKIIFAGERNIPVDIFLMIDKSLSMAEYKKFDSVSKWIKEEFIKEMLIEQDHIFIYGFYENTEELLNLIIRKEFPQ